MPIGMTPVLRIRCSVSIARAGIGAAAGAALWAAATTAYPASRMQSRRLMRRPVIGLRSLQLGARELDVQALHRIGGFARRRLLVKPGRIGETLVAEKQY